MRANIFGPGQTLVVGIAGDEWDQELVRAAAVLTQRMGLIADLTFVFKAASVPYDFPPFRFDSDLQPDANELQVTAEDLRNYAHDYLEDLRGQIADEKTRVTFLEANDIAGTLAQHCLDVQATLLLVGGTSPNDSFLARTFDRANRLECHAQLPILILPHGVRATLGGPEFKVMVADDLTPLCLPAVETALALAGVMSPSLVEDAFVGDLSEVKAEALFLETYIGAAGKKPAYADADSLTDFHRGELEHALVNHVAAACTRLGIGNQVKIQTRLLAGGTVEALRQEADRFDGDVVVFGRHKTEHRWWPTFGNHLSYEKMMSFGRPILVVPPE